MLENSLEPASSKTSITIAGIYDTEDNSSRRFTILDKINKKIAELNLKHHLKVAFPKLDADRLKKLIGYKGKTMIEKQILAKKQLSKKRVPKPEVSFKFRPPKLIDIPKDKIFETVTV